MDAHARFVSPSEGDAAFGFIHRIVYLTYTEYDVLCFCDRDFVVARRNPFTDRTDQADHDLDQMEPNTPL